MIIRNVSTKAVLSFLALLEMTNFAFWEGSWWRQSRHQLPHTLAVAVIPNEVRNLYGLLQQNLGDVLRIIIFDYYPYQTLLILPPLKYPSPRKVPKCSFSILVAIL